MAIGLIGMALLATTCGPTQGLRGTIRAVGEAAADAPSTDRTSSTTDASPTNRTPSTTDAPSTNRTPSTTDAPPTSPESSVDEAPSAADQSGEPGGTLVAHAEVQTVVARDQPVVWADEIASFDNPTKRGGPLVFQAVSEPRLGWLEVLLPMRPNGTTGWIPVDGLELTVNPYRIDVDIEAHTLTVHRFDEETLRTDVAIGTGSTPTPLGEFYLVELLRPSDPGGIYGPFAYGLSGYSETLDSFNGGEGIIGIHGTDRPDLIGTDVSHGCIRVANPTIEEMVRFLPLGTPVRIHRGDDPIVPGEVAGDGPSDT